MNLGGSFWEVCIVLVCGGSLNRVASSGARETATVVSSSHGRYLTSTHQAAY